MKVLRPGDWATLSRTVTAEDIKRFGELVGDLNPLHVDQRFAERTRFGKCIAHGMIPASLISAVLGTKLPGPGTIYLSQSLNFRAPVFPGDTIEACVIVREVRSDKPIVTLDTVCKTHRGTVVLDGQAVVLLETL